MSSVKKKLNLPKIRQLKATGLSHREIAKVMECTPQNIDYLVKQHNLLIDPKQCEEFKKHRADILASQQVRVLDSLTDEKLEKASARDLAIVFGTLYDKERLERGEGTQNISHFVRIVAAACEQD